MKRIIFKCIFVLIISIPVSQAMAQQTIRGKLTDQTTGLSIANASIQWKSGTKGTVSDLHGNFSLTGNSADSIILISHIAYQPKTVNIKTAGKSIFLDLTLEQRQLGLNEVSIISSFVRERETPLAINNISQATIEREMGSQEYPEIMKMVPGVYATKLGGGTGDARISIRGFQQENLGLLLNGVPVSSVENGLVYWSNWAGLSDATQTIQVQKGLGASRVALNSVGGTINIITKTIEASKGGVLRHSFTSYGNKKTSLSLSSGLTDKGFALTFLGSRTSGPGYVDATYVNAWAWFLSVSKQLNRRHLLVFTGLGSPEKHGQRTYGLTVQQYEQFGNKYNPNWGMFNGKINSLSENFYHKPQLSLNHYWNINEKLFIASSAYLSFGNGGGKFSESMLSESANFFRINNQIDWDAIYLQNIENTDSVQLETGETVKGFSKIIQTNYLASHIWFGGLTTLNYQVNERLKLISGLHMRYFKSNLREEISDLLGGKFWVDQYAWSLAGIAGRPQIKYVGDIINVDNDSRVDNVSYFTQADFTYKKINAFVTATVSDTWYRRFDRINYISETSSDLVNKFGFDVKSGINYMINSHNHVYLNAGYYSKAPYFKFVFANFSNSIVQDLKNEIIKAMEAGYSFEQRIFRLNFIAYYTLWEDKSLLSRENIQLEDNSQTRALIRGLDALHKGIEVETTAILSKELTLGAIVSLGDWRWNNDVKAELYDDNLVLIDFTEVYAKDLKVGDAPQVQYGLFADRNFLTNFNLKINWLYFGQLYANFDPAGRFKADDRSQPLRIPDYSVTDLHLQYQFPIAGIKTIAGLSCYNIMNNESITRGEDGIFHNLETFRGFWTNGRTFNLSMSLIF
ncbi:MAG: TonB-dependent receptor [Lentimicrobium sp.]|nr:TonB-dependent receptor [Lentimicrobium sp.]